MDTKAIVLTNRSAIECLDLYSSLLELHDGWRPTQARETLDNYGFDASTAERLHALRLPSPVELLVPSSTGKHPQDGIILRGRSGPLLLEDLIPLGEGIYVSVPELAVSMIVGRMSRPMAATIIDQLVSSYRTLRKEALSSYESSFPLKHMHILTGSDGFTRIAGTIYGLEPQTSLRLLQKYAEVRSNTFGIKRLRKSLDLCAEGLRSPLETQDHLLLFAPRSMGGCGLTRPAINKKMRLSAQSRKETGVMELTPDFLWKEKRVVVEILGKADHEGSGLRIADTSIRERVWRNLGYTSITHTSKEIHSPKLFESCARELARKLGQRYRTDIENYAVRQQWLRGEIMRNGSDMRRSVRSYRELLKDKDAWLRTY